jgi:LuxR family maltose regulon positive regulatory protein
MLPMSFEKLLVSTKFAPPRIGAKYIHRKQLLGHLRNTRHCTLALVTGSAGFGKTTLLAQWRQELMKSGAEVAWLSLGHSDKLLPHFATYLAAALRRLNIPVEDTALSEGDVSTTIESVVAMTVSGAANIAKELYLVVDDYHHVEDPWAHKLMQGLLDHCPANLHIVIASRTVPTLSISRLRAMDQVADIESAQLPFDIDETRLFFEQNLNNAKLNADELRSIHDLTHGWPASLQLIAIILRSRPGARSTLRDLGWKSSDLQSYLAEVVVADLPAEQTEFMEKVSVCRRFNADLAAAVTGRGDAADLIKRAEDANLLIYPVESDDRLPWYRFHPLFGEFLAARLARAGEETVKALHRRASHWFAQHNLLVEAVRHANLGGDLAFAVNAIEQAAPASWSFGYIGSTLRLLERLPQETLFAHPRLFFVACLTYALSSQPAKAEHWLEAIRRTDAVRNPAISSMLPLADAAVALQRDETERVVALLEPMRGIAFENRFLHYVYAAALAGGYAAVGRLADAQRFLDDNPVPPEEWKDETALGFESARLNAWVREGRVREVERVGSTIIARAETLYGRGALCANLNAYNLCEAYYELDRIDDAREILANRASLLRSSWPDPMLRASLCRARLDLMQESAESALTFLQSQSAHFHNLRLDRPLAHMLSEQVRILLARPDRARAAALVARLEDLAEAHRNATGGRREIAPVAALARARLALADRQHQAAVDALAQVRAFARARADARLEVTANLLSALALTGLDRQEAADQCLAVALRTCVRLGLVRTLLDEGSSVVELLAAARKSINLDTATLHYIEDILRRSAPVGAAVKDKSKPSAGAAQKASLTPREVEILGLVSQAMSNKRIALTLDITLETVKWNVRNILAKLGVSSRYDAMTWARQQGLIA